MKSIQGYFDGNVCIPLDKNAFKPNQKVLITPVVPKKKKKKKKMDAETFRKMYFGSISEEEGNMMLEALAECRRIDESEW